MTLGKYSDLSIKDARFEAASKMKQLREGLDPQLAKKRAEQESIKTVDELFEYCYQQSKQAKELAQSMIASFEDARNKATKVD